MLAPVVASGLGSVSSMFGLVVIALMGAIPALLIPNVTSVEIGKNSKVKASVLTPEIVLWLCCAIIDGAVVAAIEIGPVLMVIGVGFAPTMAILFTVPLCLVSVTGGVWVSWRNRKSGQIAVVVQFAAMTFGISLVAGGTSLSMTIAGTMIVGLVLAPLSTYFSLARVIRVRSLMKRSTLSAPSQSVFSDATISNIAQHLVRGNGDIQVTYRAGQPVGSHDRQKPLETLTLRV